MNDETFISDQLCPRWIKEVFRFLPVKSQFVLSGNIRDRYPFPLFSGEETRYLPYTFVQYLTETLRTKGFTRFLSYDMLDGFVCLGSPTGKIEEEREFFKERFGLKFDDRGRQRVSSEKALEVMESIVNSQDEFIAVIADFASRYVIRPESLEAQEHAFFTRALKMSHTVSPHVSEGVTGAQFNPIFWICDKENDLPSWLTMENPRIRSVVLPKPDYLFRSVFLRSLCARLSGYEDMEESQREKHRNVFSDQTDGMYLTDIVAISQLCRKEGLEFREIGEAVRRYKVGITDDPWKNIDREKIRNGRAIISDRLKGQERAIVKSLDILKRAVTGMAGMERSGGSKPKGIMFLAGPTGTGKTELAKTLTELLFGDEQAYIRFDMSEFSAEHAGDRLLGAPPGYIGYDAGGELTNAIRQKPFSVVLFDEIEKAHPRILDKFLQILDDGQLTDGRGDRVYFSESIIIFTSNLGINKLNESGQRTANVTSKETYEEVERLVREEITNHFKFNLNRPEILNRFGENIVVFDFIRPEVAHLIYEKVRDNCLNGILEKKKIKITISAAANEDLLRLCTEDLSNGGRGIGNHFEARFVNPLSRALFDEDVEQGQAITITGIREVDEVPEVQLAKDC
jgi:ATP-dependent Clp protease ATP-binding subunit ClpA